MVQLGVDVLLAERPSVLAGRRVGLVANYTVTNQAVVPVIDLLQNQDWFRLTTLFGPEHGVRNSAREGEHVSFMVDPHTGLPTYSLYGETREPSSDMLEAVDALVIDLQDVGARYYTNMNTMALCLKACQQHNIPAVVLDRPNPIGGVVREGNILEPAFSSFVGMYPMPNRHGLTMGELARYFNHTFSLNADLTVMAMQGWQRQMLWEDTGLAFVSPSPNTTTLDMMLLYPGTCLFEGTNLSLGRGTTHPFEVVGAPFLDGHLVAEHFNALRLNGVSARATYFVPNYSQHQGELCSGIQLHVTDRHRLEPVRVGIKLLETLTALYPDTFQIIPAKSTGRSAFQRLAGTDRLEGWISEGTGEQYLVQAGDKEWETFNSRIEPFLLYR